MGSAHNSPAELGFLPGGQIARLWGGGVGSAVFLYTPPPKKTPSFSKTAKFF